MRLGTAQQLKEKTTSREREREIKQMLEENIRSVLTERLENSTHEPSRS